MSFQTLKNKFIIDFLFFVFEFVYIFKKYIICCFCRYNQIEIHLHDIVMHELSLVNSNLVVYCVLLRLSMRRRLLMKRLR